MTRFNWISHRYYKFKSWRTLLERTLYSSSPKEEKYIDESLPDWVWPNFFPTVLKDFGKVPGDIFVKIKLIQKSSKKYLSRNYVHMYDLSFFDLFRGFEWGKKGFPGCKGNKTSKKIHVNDVLGYSLFLITTKSWD